jgi:hypothetical protein
MPNRREEEQNVVSICICEPMFSTSSTMLIRRVSKELYKYNYMEKQTPLKHECIQVLYYQEHNSMWQRDLTVLRRQSYKLAGVLPRKPLLYAVHVVAMATFSLPISSLALYYSWNMQCKIPSICSDVKCQLWCSCVEKYVIYYDSSIKR